MGRRRPQKPKSRSRSPDDGYWVPTIVWNDAEWRLNMLAERQQAILADRDSKIAFRVQKPKAAPSSLVSVGVRSLILGPDGKPLETR